jgi:hypothetical protein
VNALRFLAWFLLSPSTIKNGGSGKLFAGLKFGFSFHCDLSNNFGVLPELSYTLQASANNTEARSNRSKRSTAALRGSSGP